MSPIQDPALVWLVGPSGAGKSTWADEHFRPEEIVSSDELRARLGSGEADLTASAEAFEVLERIAVARLARGLTAVVDTLGFDEELRERLRVAAGSTGLPSVAVVFDADVETCLARNRSRVRPVPVGVLRRQAKRHPAVVDGIEAAGWAVHRVSAPSPAAVEPVPTSPKRRQPSGFRFFLHVSRFGETPVESMLEQARAAAAAGFAGISLMDHLIQIPQAGRRWDPILDPYVGLARISAEAPGLEVGVLVSPITFRHVAVVAKMLSTLDLLSGGRAFCGLGAGWFEAEHANLRIPFPSAGARVTRLEDTVGALRALWGAGSKPFVSPTIEIPDSTAYPRPVRGTIPILIGGGGERRTIPIAARLADRWNLPSGIDKLDRKLDALRRECERIGRDPAEIETSVLAPALVGRDRAHVAELVERHRGSEEAASFARRTRVATVDRHIEWFSELSEKVDAVFVTTPDSSAQAVERFAPVVEAFGR